MVKHFFKILSRSFSKNLLQFLIVVGGLAIGLASIMFIIIYLNIELSYDKHFKKSDQIYRVTSLYNINGKESNIALSSIYLGQFLKNEYPEILEYVRFIPTFKELLFSDKNNDIYMDGVFYTDSNVFNVFPFELLYGTQKALNEPNTIVLTENAARKFFGDDNPIGKYLNLNHSTSLKVTGVIKNGNKYSHIQFNALISSHSLLHQPSRNKSQEIKSLWLANNYTYILLSNKSDVTRLKDKLKIFYNKYKLNESNKKLEFKLQNITRIHLHSNLEYEIAHNNNIKTIYVFVAILILILTIASINFINLYTATSASRFKEIAIKKVFGSSKLLLIKQFIFETFFYFFITSVISIVFVLIGLNYFSNFIGTSIDYTFLFNFRILVLFVSLIILASLIAGSYSSIALVSLNPISVFKKKTILGNKGGLRKVLVIIQFSLSVSMLISIFHIHKQLEYMKHMDLGFNKNNIVLIHMDNNYIASRFSTFKHELIKNPQIINVALSHATIGKPIGKEAISVEGNELNEEHSFDIMYVSPNYLDCLGMQIIEGRNFDETNNYDKKHAYIVNETAVKYLNWHEPLNKRLFMGYDNFGFPIRDGKVIGVVRDFNFYSLHQKISPLLILIYPFPAGEIHIKINGNFKKDALNFIEEKWNELYGDYHLKYSFLEDDIDQNYQREKKMKVLFSFFAFISIFISIIGLYGLTSFLIKLKVNEIGIRKVFGASTFNIFFFFSKDYLKLILISILIGWISSYFFINWWLQNFIYKTTINFYLFIAGGFVLLLIAMSTIMSKVVKASQTNPCETIKYE